MTLSSGGQSVTLYQIAVPDRPLCYVGLTLLAAALKRAEKALRSVNCSSDAVTLRKDECERLQKAFTEKGPALELGIPMGLLPTLRVALAIEFDHATKVLENQQDLAMDTEETELRVKQLGRLLADLDMAQMGGETTE
jgi:hypothetical protein